MSYSKQNWLSQVSYFWIDKHIWKSNKDVTLLNDLKPEKCITVDENYQEFEKIWKQEVHQFRPSLIKTLWKIYKKEILLTGFFKLCWSAFMLLSAFFFVNSLLDFVKNKTKYEQADGILYAVFFFVCTFFLNVSQQMMNHIGNRVGCKIASLIQYEIYKKSFQLENITSSRAYVANLLANDVQKIQEVCTQFHILYSAPIETIVIISLLISLIGYSGFIAFGIFLFILPILVFTGKAINKLRMQSIKFTDKRLSIIQESISQIKLIKFYGWERFFVSIINHIRKEEMKTIKTSTFIKAMSLQLVFIVPPLIAFVLFVEYTSRNENEKLDAKLAFTTLSLFNTLRFPLVILPKSIKAFSDFLNALNRIQSFLVQPDLESIHEENIEVKRKASNIGLIKQNSQNEKDQVIVSYKNVRLGYTVNEPSEIARTISQAYRRKVNKKYKLQQIEENISKNQNSHKDSHDENNQLSDSQPAVDKKQQLTPFRIRFDTMVQKTLEDCVTVLENINLTIKKGEKVAIVGPLGSGKSTLLKSFLNQVRVTGGKVKLGYTDNKLAYLPQFPWVFSGTIRENILLNYEYDDELYQKTIFACALDKDINNFTHGDLHLLSEKGSNLSGGQRQRLSLCRAVYRNYDYYFLDAPLAAVDYATGKHIIKNCFKGLLKEKTIIKVTHQLHYLDEFDKIIVLKNKTVAYFGPYDKSVIDREFPNYNDDHQGEQENNHGGIDLEKPIEKTNIEQQDLDSSVNEGLSTQDLSNKLSQYKLKSNINNSDNNSGNKSPQDNNSLTNNQVISHIDQKQVQISNEEKAKLKHNDSLDHNKISICMKQLEVKQNDHSEYIKELSQKILKKQLSFSKNFLEWIKHGGSLFFILVSFIYALTQTCRIITDQWVGWWTNDRFGHSSMYYALMYGLLVLIFGVLLFFRGLSFYYFTITTCQNIHFRTIAQVLTGTFYFFQNTSIGQILENFSKDQDVIDDQLPDVFQVTYVYVFILATTTIIVCITLPIYTLVIGILLIAFILFVKRFITVCYQLKALNKKLSADIISQVSETLEGVSIIKSYNSQNYCINKLKEFIDYNSTTVFLQSQTQLWLAFRFDFVGSLLILTVGLIVVLQDYTASASGLAISNCFQSLIFLTWVVKGFADIAINLESVQNMNDYFSIEDEYLVLKEQKAKNTHNYQAKINAQLNQEIQSYLTTGEIEFKNVSLSYDKKALVLKNISMKIEPGQKIGIIGRTGAGKSSVIMSLMRLFELKTGQILIDGTDIAKLKLDVLRKSIGILPQDTMMFQSSFRSNLDPLNEYTDKQIWEALDKCFMKEFIESLPDKLETIVDESGKNFSLGQKQLVSLGRALLKKSKILVLDEATASMDLETEKKLQIVLNQEFQNTTRLTIAHRIDTVAESDKIAVLKMGELVEFDSPYNLINNPKSLFYEYVMLAGDHAQSVIDIINNNHQKKIQQQKQ